MKRVVKTPFPSSSIIRDPQVLGAAVKAARTEFGLSMVDAALMLGIATQTLADLEMGKPTVSLGILLKTVQGLGLALHVGRKGSELFFSEE